MKVYWEEADVTVGRVVQKADCGLTGSWMIGYRYRDTSGSAEDNSQVYGLVSLADGMFMDIGSKVEVVTYLNEHKELIPLELTDMTIEFNPDPD